MIFFEAICEGARAGGCLADAALAACVLHDMGYLHVRSIPGGIDAWVAGGGQTAKPGLPSFE